MAGNNLKVYNTFSGVDIHAVFGDTIFGELQMVSYKIDREKAPVYTMGSADLRTIARGKRLISGACVFVVFDRDSLLETMNNYNIVDPSLNKHEYANLDTAGYRALYQAGATTTQITNSTNFTDATLEANAIASQYKQNMKAKLADQLLAFDITMVGANEYGAVTKMVIHGVELMTEASGISIDDLVIEKQFSFLARRVTNWTGGQPISGSAVAVANQMFGDGNS